MDLMHMVVFSLRGALLGFSRHFLLAKYTTWAGAIVLHYGWLQDLDLFLQLLRENPSRKAENLSGISTLELIS